MGVSAWPAGENAPSVAFKNTIDIITVKVQKKISPIATTERVADGAYSPLPTQSPLD